MKKNAFIAWWFSWILSISLSLPLIAGSQLMEESISGRSFRAIQVAVTELERNKLNVGDYRITLQQSDRSIFVLFRNPNASQEQRGSSGPRPTFSVELSNDGLQVIRSQFER